VALLHRTARLAVLLAAVLAAAAAAAPAGATVYEVGPGLPLDAIGDAPWATLAPGDEAMAPPRPRRWTSPASSAGS